MKIAQLRNSIRSARLIDLSRAMALYALGDPLTGGRLLVDGQSTPMDSISGAASLRAGAWSGRLGQMLASTYPETTNLFPNPCVGTSGNGNIVGFATATGTSFDVFERSTRYDVRAPGCDFAVSGTNFTAKATTLMLTNASVTSLSNAGTVDTNLLTQAIKVKPNTAYTISFYAYLDAPAGNGQLSYTPVEVRADNTTFSPAFTTLSQARVLTRVTLTYTTSTTGVGLSMKILPLFAGTLYISGVQIEEGASATPLITPSTGGVWTVVPHASAIRRPGIRAVHTLDATINLITNPSAETTIAGFSPTPDAITNTSRVRGAAPGGGAWSAQVQTLSGPDVGGVSTGCAISTITTYACSIYFKGIAGRSYTYDVTSGPNTGRVSRINGGVQTFTATGYWQRLTATATAVSGDDVLLIVVRRVSRSGAEIFWVDNAQIEQRTYCSEYTDGDRAGAIQTPALGVPTDWATSASDLGQAGGRTKIAESFVAPTTFRLGAVRTWVYKTGLPTDNLIARICADNAGLPGTDMGGSPVAVAGSPLSTASDGLPVDFTFDAPVLLTAGTRYWITLERSGAADATNYYFVKTSNLNPDPDGLLAIFTGSWATAAGWDMAYGLYDDSQSWLWDAYSWSGDRHNSTSSRAAGNATIAQSILDGRQGTIGVWFLVDDVTSNSTQQCLVSLGTSTDYSLNVYRANNLISISIQRSGTTLTSAATSIPTWSSWNHLAVVWDGSDVRLYINGVLEKTLASTHLDVLDFGQIVLGGSLTGTNQFNGRLHLTAYTRPLSETEITAIASLSRAPGWREY